MRDLAGDRRAMSDWIADHPMSIPGRLAATRFGRPRGPLPPVIRADDSPTRVLMAPANYAGQARAWCAALERFAPLIQARNYAREEPFGYPADAVIPLSMFHNSRRWQQAQANAARGFTHFLVESFIPPFGRLLGRDLERQLGTLTDQKVAFMCHGTDVRRPSLNRERTPWAAVGDAHADGRQETYAQRNLDLLARWDRPVFVSTPDLVEDVPRALWCPVVVDTDRWASERRETSAPLRVVHAPSNAKVKGSQHIEPVLERLAARGVIDYAPVRGVPHARMPDVIAAADIIVDQIGTGSYGVAACEAMAAGCVVIGHVTERTRETVASQTGLRLPIVEADPETLEMAVSSLATDAARRVALVRESTRFVREVHDGRLSVEKLTGDWLSGR